MNLPGAVGVSLALETIFQHLPVDLRPIRFVVTFCIPFMILKMETPDSFIILYCTAEMKSVPVYLFVQEEVVVYWSNAWN